MKKKKPKLDSAAIIGAIDYGIINVNSIDADEIDAVHYHLEENVDLKLKVKKLESELSQCKIVDAFRKNKIKILEKALHLALCEADEVVHDMFEDPDSCSQIKDSDYYIERAEDELWRTKWEQF